MSETSFSLQVRTDTADECIARLQASGFTGAVFQGAKGWLTVVPYGGPEAINMTNDALARFSTRLAAPVLLYHYTDDFGWGFQVGLPDGRTTAAEFLSAEVMEAVAEAGVPTATLDAAVISGLMPQEWIDRLVQRQSLALEDSGEGQRFAHDMGFPEFSWLSPSYVTEEPDEVLRRSGQDIGRRPDPTPGYMF